MSMTSIRTCLALGCLLAPWAAPAAPAADLFAGYSQGLLESGRPTYSAKADGWNLAATLFPFGGRESRWSLATEVSGFRGANWAGGTSAYQTYFLAGPRFRTFRKGLFEANLQVLAGGAHRTASAELSYSELSPAAALGSNFDFRISRRLSFRMSPGFYFTKFAPENYQKNFRASAGLVFRLGSGE